MGMKWVGLISLMEEMKNSPRILAGRLKERGLVGQLFVVKREYQDGFIEKFDMSSLLDLSGLG
jgi:hypothetical protein